MPNSATALVDPPATGTTRPVTAQPSAAPVLAAAEQAVEAIRAVPAAASRAKRTLRNRAWHWVRFPWLNRSRRVLFALASVWIIATFDLAFTTTEFGSHTFVELNPIAAKLLHGSETVVYAYKFGLLGVGTLILLLVRRHFVAELASWFLFAAMFYVAVRWFAYFDFVINDSPLTELTP